LSSINQYSRLLKVSRHDHGHPGHRGGRHVREHVALEVDHAPLPDPLGSSPTTVAFIPSWSSLTTSLASFRIEK
jgi:hypothetical protein